MPLARTIDLDVFRVQEEFYERGWTDGLPVVPPTPELVEAMLAAAGVEADDVIGTVAARGISVLAGQAATNAVMAGCKAEYFPVVVAALGAMLDPALNAHMALASTGGSAMCLVVSGPYAAEIGMNARHNAMGPGNRANATIGRAVRLVAMNVLGARAGKFDASTLGNPGKYTMCFAENDPPAPWQPLRVQLGYQPEDTTVTVFASDSPKQIANHLNGEAMAVMRTVVSAMRVPATFPVGKGGQCVVVLGPEHAGALIEGGKTQMEVREFLARESRITPAELEAAGILPEEGSAFERKPGADGLLPAVESWEDVLLVTAGGEGAGWSAYIPSFSPAQVSRAVTRRVQMAGEALPDCGPDGCVIDLSRFTLTAVSQGN